ncbi:MAG: pyruvate kinase, partial [Opitutae bacterium]|nr:pyruvate kinase [Opitutae bacterium]
MENPATMRKTKIVCTIGPASDSPDIIRRMMDAGMNVARLNFSHGTREAHAAKIALIRQIAAEKNLPIAILQDLAGPKIRTGVFACGSIELKTGDTFTLTARDVPGNDKEVGLTYRELPQDV